MGPGLKFGIFVVWKIIPIALNLYRYFGVVYHILCLYTLLKVVSYYDLSVLSKSVMVSKKKVWMGCELYPSFFLNFLTLQSP